MLLSLLGIFLILFVLSDVVQTALLPYSGPFTRRFTTLLWAGALRLHWRASSHRLLALAGVALLLITITVWGALLWLGWTFVFLAGDPAIVTTSDSKPATIWGTFYFTGYSLITLGNGDLRPTGPLWQLLVVLASVSGFFFFSLAITFLFSVVSAAVQMRQAAVYISSLGETPFDLVACSWNGEHCQALILHLTTLMSMVSGVGQQHLAYPVLHYLHTAERGNALPLKIAVLDEALSYLEHGVSERCRISAAELGPLRRMIGAYLLTLDAAFLSAAREIPPSGSLAALRDRGIQTVEDDAFESALGEHAQRRKLLLALVERDGWSWQDVYRKDDPPTPREKVTAQEVQPQRGA